MDPQRPGVPRAWPSHLQSPQEPQGVWSYCQGRQASPTPVGAGPTRALTSQSSGLLLAVSLLGQRLCLATRGQCSPGASVGGPGSVRACARGGGDQVEARPIFPSGPHILSLPRERCLQLASRNPGPITPCSQHFWAVHANFENPSRTSA